LQAFRTGSCTKETASARDKMVNRSEIRI